MRSSTGCQEALVAISQAAWEGQLSANPGEMRTRRGRALQEKKVRISRSWRCAARSDLPADTNSTQLYFPGGETIKCLSSRMHPKAQKALPCRMLHCLLALTLNTAAQLKRIAINDPGTHVRACAHQYVSYSTQP